MRKRLPVGLLHLRHRLVKRFRDQTGQRAVAGPVDGVAQSFEKGDRQGDGHALLPRPEAGRKVMSGTVHTVIIGLRRFDCCQHGGLVRRSSRVIDHASVVLSYCRNDLRRATISLFACELPGLSLGGRMISGQDRNGHDPQHPHDSSEQDP